MTRLTATLAFLFASQTLGQDASEPEPFRIRVDPKEINVPPRAWVERSLGDRVIHWTEMFRGGHFAAMEEPKRLVDDVRAFFAEVRKRGRE